MLRLDAERFGVAEYDEATRDGHLPSFRRRIAWYVLGVGLVVSASWSSTRRRSGTCSCGSGDRVADARSRASSFGVDRGGPGGRLRVAPLPPPPPARGRARTRARSSTRSRPRSSTRRRSAASCSGSSWAPASTRPSRTCCRRCSTPSRRASGAPGRDRYMLVLSLVIGLVGGWLTLATGGIGAAFLGHAVTRFAVFLCTGHAGQVAPRGTGARGHRAAAAAARGLADHRHRGEPRRSRAAARRALRPRAVLRLALPVLRLRRVRRARRRAGRATGSQPSSTRWRPSSACGPTRRTPDSGLRARPSGRRSTSVYLGGGTPSLLAADAVAALLAQVRDAVRGRRRRRDHPRGQPRAGRARRRRGPRAGRRHAPVDRAPRASTGGAPEAGPAARPGGRAAAAVARPARRASHRSGSTCCTTCRARPPPPGPATLDAALALEPDHLSLYALTLDDPDAEGLTGPAATTCRDAPARAAGASARAQDQDEDRAADAVRPRRRTGSPRAGFRGYEISQLGAPRPREPAQPRLLGAPPVRGGRAGRARLRRRRTRRWNAARLDAYLAALAPPTGRPPRLPPGGRGVRRSDDGAEAEEVILAPPARPRRPG